MEQRILCIRTFGIGENWKTTTLEAEMMWVATVTEGDGRRFMAACRKEEVDAARHRRTTSRKERHNETGKNGIVHESVESAKRNALAKSTSRRNPVRARDGPARPA